MSHINLINSTNQFRIVLLLFLWILSFGFLYGQTSYTVNTGGSADIYTPNSLTINIGDTVVWNNIGGFHNVNGTLSTYPSNPEGFGNGSSSSTAWTYSHVFTLPGTYNYQCDPHAMMGMTGVITVNSNNCPPVLTYSTVDATDAFTNDGEITVTVDPLANGPFDYYLFDITGNILQGPFMSQTSNVFTFSNLSSGYYEFAVNNQECSSAGFSSIDSVYIYTINGGTISYSGFMGYCGSSGADIVAYSSGCGSPNTLGNEFILTTISGVLIDSTVAISDSISYTGLLANQYILQITNLDNNCVSVDTFVISSGVIQSSYTYTNPTSASTADGSITITVSGATPPLYISTDNGSSYNPWNNGTSVTGLLQGTYTIYVVDANGCQSTNTVTLVYNNCTATIDTIGSCDQIWLTAQTTNVLLGNYSYTYNLSFEGSLIETLNSNLDSIVFNTMVSDSGQYSIEIINDSTGCISNDAMVINPNTMSINILTLNDVSSQGACDGFIAIEVLGGSFPYNITWTDGSGTIISGPTAPFNTSSIPNLCEDNYCIQVTDGTPCSITECFDIVFTSCNVNLTIADSIDCFGGLGQITASVDTSAVPIGPIPFVDRYTYTLYALNPQVQIGPNQNTNNLSITYPGLPAGYYLVEVIDNSYGTSCSSDSILLTEPNPINIYLTTDSTSAPWIYDGSILIDSITGGTSPYSFQWLDSVGIPFSSSSTSVTGLGYSNQFNGGFTLVVTDTNGCTQQQTVYIHPNNAGANLAVDSVGVQDASCYGLCDGKLYMLPYDVGPSSVPPFTYVWTNAVTGVVMRVDSLGSSQYNGPPSHVATYTNRCAGFYTLQIYDYYGNSLPPIDFTVNQPDSIFVDLGLDIVLDCGEDTVLTANAVGGNQTNDTTLINTFILDFDNPNGIGDTLMTGGLYYLEVSGTFSDGFGNNYDAAYDYTAAPPTEVMYWNYDGTNTHRPSPNVYDPSHVYVFPFIAGNNGGIPGMGVHTWSVPSSNYTGQLTCNLYAVDTGIYNYGYTWTSNPLQFPIIISDEDTCYMNPGLTPTDYIVNVVDDLGCIATDTVNVSWDLYILNAQTNTTDVVPCYGDAAGTINVSVDTSSGFSPYSYTVLDISGNTINTLSSLDTTFNLLSGDYVVYIQDNLGCLSYNDTVTITEPDSIWACGIGNLNNQFLIDNFVMDFDTISTTFNHSTPIPTLFGVNYLVVVNGTYGLEFFNSNHKDAAFIISSGIPTDDWTINGLPLRPDNDVYVNSHQYSYTVSGNGNPMLFSFTDLNGTYSDNAGSLSFSVYKLGCANIDTVYTCSGDSTGSSSISATGGVPFDPDGIPNSGDEYYNFTWNDLAGNNWTNYSVTNGVNSTINGIPAGDYVVTISDSNGCDNYERYLKVIEAPTPLVIDSTNVFDVLCFGQVTAGVNAYFSGGFGPYLTVLTHVNGGVIDTVYQSLTDTDSVVVDSLIYGSYTLYIYDSIPDNLNGTYFCPQIFTFNITQPQSPMSSTINLLSHVSCWGDSTGKARVIPAGGQSQLPYTYLWDNGETTAIADSLWADVNSAWPSPQWQGVTITDANGCTLRDSIQIEHLNEEIKPFNTLDGTNTVQIIQNVQCFNACDAIVTISSVGGVLPHTYFWDMGNIGNFMPDTVIGICYGGHDIIIEDQVGCRKTVEYQISQPDELFANASVVDHVDCYGYDNGIAHGTATGGTLGYTFVWDSIGGQLNDTAYNLTPGIHTVFVTDANGCTASDTVTITEPTELSVVIQDSSTVYSYCTGTNTAELCAIAFGGIEPYNYVWSDVLGQTTSCADNLLAGIYTVTVLDDEGCSASDTRNIDSVTNSMQATTAVTDVSCFGLSDGSTYVDNVIGAVAPYDYSWTYPNGTIVTQNNINFLYAGNYAVTITDSNNCSITIYSNIEEPDQLEYTLYNVVDATCFGACDGSISVSVEGGTSPYSYDFDEIGSFPFANSVPLINDSMILNLCAGDYDIYITDDNDCIGTVLWGGVWEATIDSGVVVDIHGVNVTQSASCYNSSDGHANIMFPNPLFTYTWETLAGDIIDTGVYTTILGGGSYNVVAHYADSASFGQNYTGCDFVYNFNMPSPSQINANEIIVPISCYGDADGSISLNASGGSGGNYTYQWDTTVSVPNGSTSSAISNLQEDTYTVTITDGSGCTETIPYPMLEPDALTNNFTDIIHASCNGDNDGSVRANPSGGTPPYSYSWSPAGGNGQIANGLIANTYTVTISDTRSCEEDFEITINQPDQIISGVEANAFYGNDPTGVISYHISCNGLSDGSAIVNLGGGTPPYDFVWTTGGSDQLESNMPAGTHSVTVTDDNGCSETMSLTLVEPDQLLVNGSSSGDYSNFPGAFDISCKGLNDGECYADPSGGVPGTAGYMYSWSGPLNGQISNLNQVINLYVGTYSVTVTDANGCTDSQSFTLTEPSDIFVSTIHLVGYPGASVSPVSVSFEDATVTVDNIQHTFYWPSGDSNVYNLNGTTSQNTLFPLHIFDVENDGYSIGQNTVNIKVQNMNSGCIDDTTFVIEIQGIPDIGNVFTPNGDGVNDYFDFGEYAMESINVHLYNRWGELVYSWETLDTQWDGRGLDGQDLPEGVYYYVLKSVGVDGFVYDKRGSITLLR